MEQSRTSPGEIITFYSYKGGTGRSMALANVACVLAQRGHRVIVIDWDLEAPGLHRFLRPFNANRDARNTTLESEFDAQGGLIDIFVEFRRLLSSGHCDSERAYDQLFTSIMVESLLNENIISTGIPKLDMIKAGRFNDHYPERVRGFDWRDVYNQVPGLFAAFADCLTNRYEYVLIDSRTGITDSGGICTALMPEKLVVVFTPNRQSVVGVLEVGRRALQYRQDSNDLRTLKIFPLPSRIEANEPELRASYRFGNPSLGVPGYQPLFEELFRQSYSVERGALDDYFDEVQIQHIPFYAYGEVVAVLREGPRDKFSLRASYERFADILTSENVPWEYRHGRFITE